MPRAELQVPRPVGHTWDLKTSLDAVQRDQEMLREPKQRKHGPQCVEIFVSKGHDWNRAVLASLRIRGDPPHLSMHRCREHIKPLGEQRPVRIRGTHFSVLHVPRHAVVSVKCGSQRRLGSQAAQA